MGAGPAPKCVMSALEGMVLIERAVDTVNDKG